MSILSPEALTTPRPGNVVEVAEGVRRLTAPNPSLMTGPGTNSYIVGEQELVVIDPGPVEEEHLEALAEATAGRLAAVLVTHAHPDHAPGAARLSEMTGALVLGFDERRDFRPDRKIAEGDQVALGDFPLTALHTPGHASDHLCFLSQQGGRILFSGDHVMGGSTVVIAPPDGNMADYLASLERLLQLSPPLGAIAPGHGPALTDPADVVRQYIGHRLARESAVLAALSARHRAFVDEIVAAVYTDVSPELHPIARYSVWAHLLKLRQEGAAASPEPEDLAAPWQAVGQP